MATVHVVLRPQVGVFPVLLRRPCSIIDEADLAGPLRWILCECSSVHPLGSIEASPKETMCSGRTCATCGDAATSGRFSGFV